MVRLRYRRGSVSRDTGRARERIIVLRHLPPPVGCQRFRVSFDSQYLAGVKRCIPGESMGADWTRWYPLSLLNNALTDFILAQ